MVVCSMRLSRFYSISIIVLLALAFIGSLNSIENRYELNSQYGEVDFSSVDKTQVYTLGGSWEYYEESLYEDILQIPNLKKGYVNIPHNWESNPKYNDYAYGYATYVTEIKGLNPDKYYGIKIIDEGGSYRLFINNKYIISNGKVGRLENEYSPEFHTKVGAFHPDELGKAKLVIEVANFNYNRGGLWTKPRIGEFEIINEMSQRHNSKEVFLFTSMLLMGFFLYALYFKMRSEKTAFLMGGKATLF